MNAEFCFFEPKKRFSKRNELTLLYCNKVRKTRVDTRNALELHYAFQAGTGTGSKNPARTGIYGG